PAVNDLAHRELDDLVRLGPRDVPHLEHDRRNVPRRGVLAYARPDFRHERLVELAALAELDEQHDAHVADLPRRPGLADDDRLDDFVELLALAVDLGGSDAHTAGVENGVGAPVDDHPTVRGDLAPVAVRPDAGKPLEVRRVVFLPARVVPEAERQRG